MGNYATIMNFLIEMVGSMLLVIIKISYNVERRASHSSPDSHPDTRIVQFGQRGRQPKRLFDF